MNLNSRKTFFSKSVGLQLTRKSSPWQSLHNRVLIQDLQKTFLHASTAHRLTFSLKHAKDQKGETKILSVSNPREERKRFAE